MNSTITSQPHEGLVYAFGRLGYDFGTDARLDSFCQYHCGEDKDKAWDFKNPRSSLNT